MRQLLEDRAVIRIEGPSSRDFLQGLISQDVAAADESLAFTALLTPQGKIVAEFFFVRTGEGYLVDCSRSIAEVLLKRLSLYRLRAEVKFDLLPDFAVGAATARGADVERLAVFDDPRAPGLGCRAIGPRAALETQGAPPGARTYDRRRIELGVPELGKDFAPDEMFLLDVNYDALNAVNYKKGCFVGQEVTSRMKRKGEIRRRTLIARFDGAPPPKGAPVTAGGSTLGEILSGVEGAALAAIRLDRLEAAAGRGDPVAAGAKALKLSFPEALEAV